MPNNRTTEEILEVLRDGNFDLLVGTVEDARVEAKGEPYQLALSGWYKQELAKDVSALANTGGGIILIGFRTVKETLTAVERIEACRPFELALFDVDQHRKVLQDWINPSIHSVRIECYPSSSDANKGVGAIIVPPESTDGKPYVVTRAVDQDGRVCGTMVGYYERVQDLIPPTSAATLRNHLRDGARFNELSERLTSIEAMLGRLSTPLGAESAVTGLSDEEIRQRIANAEAAAERIHEPNIVLSAASDGRCSFPQLFQSRSAPIVQLLENPPSLREDGFAVQVPKQSSIINGELRRCVTPGYELIDVWQDGLLLCLGPGDYALLCWARNPQPNAGLWIRNFVLAEVTLNFLNLAVEIFKHAEPLPEKLRFRISLENMTVDGLPCILSTERDNIHHPRRGQKKTANQTTISSQVETSFHEIDLGTAAYELLGRIYAAFGFDYSDMPYVQDDSGTKRITKESLLCLNLKE
jgi:hypothetical protein